ncbi:MAG: hypothetical protein JNK23_07165 [Opitutaceae bacterium]|nr:hypothetical protein [Opitutaceae bacterium]
MSKFYLITPLAALVVFATVQRRHAHEFHAQQAELRRIATAAREARDRELEAARDAAREAAVAAQEQRRRAVEEKARLALAQREAREEAVRQRDAAEQQERALRRQLDTLRAEIESENRALATEREKVRQLEREKADLDQGLAFAGSMQAALHRVRDEIEAADAQRRMAGSNANPPPPRR